MIKPNTVFVVGAGGSIPYGFPSGRDLLFQASATHPDTLHAELRSLFTLAQVHNFCRFVRAAQTESLDALLEHKSGTDLSVGKLFMAHSLLRCERQTEEYPKGAMPEIIEASRNGDWIRWLFSRMVEGVGCAEDFVNINKTTFITYNYDRLIEHRFAKGLVAQFEETYDAALAVLEALPMIHLHGSLGNLRSGARNYVPFAAGATEEDRSPDEKIASCQVSANAIQIVKEAHADTSEFNQARKLLNEAERVFFLGFGFGHTNVQRLDLASVNANAMIYHTRKGMTEQEWLLDVADPFTRVDRGKRQTPEAAWDCIALLRENVRDLVMRY